MTVYKFCYTFVTAKSIVTPEGVVLVKNVEWFGSERDAAIRRLFLFSRGLLLGQKKDHMIWIVDIPTDKKGLLKWLNEGMKL